MEFDFFLGIVNLFDQQFCTERDTGKALCTNHALLSNLKKKLLKPQISG